MFILSEKQSVFTLDLPAGELDLNSTLTVPFNERQAEFAKIDPGPHDMGALFVHVDPA